MPKVKDKEMWGQGVVGEWVRGEGIKKYKLVVIDQPWGCKVHIGKGVAKELTYMTHGHEQGWGDCLRVRGVLGGGEQRGINQENCNSVINKINVLKNGSSQKQNRMGFS